MVAIAHITTVDEWESARNMGEYEVSTLGVSLEEAGFVHAVALDGVRTVLDERYADIRYGLVLMILDTEALTADGIEITEESPGYPHVHGRIPTDGEAVLAVLPIDRENGDFLIPDLTGFGTGPTLSTDATAGFEPANTGI